MATIIDTKAIADAQEVKGRKLLERGFGWARDLRGGRAVVIWSDLPEETRKEGWFRIKNDKQEMILNKFELQYLLRNV